MRGAFKRRCPFMAADAPSDICCGEMSVNNGRTALGERGVSRSFAFVNLPNQGAGFVVFARARAFPAVDVIVTRRIYNSARAARDITVIPHVPVKSITRRCQINRYQLHITRNRIREDALSSFPSRPKTVLHVRRNAEKCVSERDCDPDASGDG